MSKDDEFSLPEIDFLFEHEVEDKEHPIYKELGSDDYHNAQYEDSEDDDYKSIDDYSDYSVNNAHNDYNVSNADNAYADSQKRAKSRSERVSRNKGASDSTVGDNRSRGNIVPKDSSSYRNVDEDEFAALRDISTREYDKQEVANMRHLDRSLSSDSDTDEDSNHEENVESDNVDTNVRNASNSESKPVRRKVVKRRKKVSRGGKNNAQSGGNKKHVDKKTGIEYELLPGSDKEAVKAFKASKGAGLSLDQMRKYTDLADGFSGFDLNADAERFLPHLQVPISKEERAAALKALEEAKERERRKLEEGE